MILARIFIRMKFSLHYDFVKDQIVVLVVIKTYIIVEIVFELITWHFTRVFVWLYRIPELSFNQSVHLIVWVLFYDSSELCLAIWVNFHILLHVVFEDLVGPLFCHVSISIDWIRMILLLGLWLQHHDDKIMRIVSV